MRVLVITSSDNRRAGQAMVSLCAFLHERGIGYECASLEEMPSCAEVYGAQPRLLSDKRFTRPFDLMFVLGGDGTILRAARLAAVLGTPILGANYGHLGFLSNTSSQGVVAVAEAFLRGDCSCEQLPSLKVSVMHEGGCPQGEEPQGALFAFNDIALSRIPYEGTLEVGISVSGQRLAAVSADGVIVASPTGSTSYALSAGGPLVAPGVKGMLIVPVAPRTLQARTVVAGEHDVVELSLSPRESGGRSSLLIDGELIAYSRAVRTVAVRCGDAPVTLLRVNGEGFYKKAAEAFFKV